MLHIPKKTITLLIPVVLLAIIILGWRFFTNSDYETIIPTRGKAVQAVYATGVTEPVNRSTVSAQITGRIKTIKEDEGSNVSQDQVLASLDDSVEQAKVVELTAHLTYLEKELQRKKALSERDVASARDYQQVQSDYNATQAQLKAQNELIDRMQITAPMEGVVLRRDIEPGEIAMQGIPIYWIGQVLPLRISAEVDEEDIPLVKLGQHVLIKADAFPQEVFHGTVMEVTPKGDPVNKSFRVRISLPDDTKLLIGMTIEVNIVTKEEENALLVPASSVINNAVWVKHGSKITKQKITSGIRDEENIQILEGITEEDSILLNPGVYLAEKQKKKP